MDEKDKTEFATTINALTAQYRVEPNTAMLLGYWMGLSDLTLDAVNRAATEALRTSEFMPTVAKIRELAGVLNPTDRAVIAWRALSKAMVKHGYYDSIQFDDPVLNATIRNLGGWIEWAERSEREEEKWLRKDFDRIYISLCRTGVSDVEGGPLTGWHDRGNALTGHTEALKQPIRFLTGLPAACLPAPKQPAITEDPSCSPEKT